MAGRTLREMTLSQVVKEPITAKRPVQAIKEKKRDLTVVNPRLTSQLKLEASEQSWLRDELRQTYLEIKFLEDRQQVGVDDKGNPQYVFTSETTYELLERRKLMGAIYKLWSGDRYRTRDETKQLEEAKERNLEDKLEALLELIIGWESCANECNQKLSVRIQEILGG